jgi:hypothetical protein
MRNAALMTLGILLLCYAPASASTAVKSENKVNILARLAHQDYLPSMPPQSVPAAGTVEYAELVVTNESDGQIIVLLDATNQDLSVLSDPGTATIANVHAHHGRLVNARSSTTFTPVTINAGHTIHVAFTSAMGKSPGSGTGETNTFSFSAANSGRVAVRTGGHLSQNVVRVTGHPGAPPQLALVNLTLRRELAFASFGLCGIFAMGLVSSRFNRKRPE